MGLFLFVLCTAILITTFIGWALFSFFKDLHTATKAAGNGHILEKISLIGMIIVAPIAVITVTSLTGILVFILIQLAKHG